jgi:hypothetical protein
MYVLRSATSLNMLIQSHYEHGYPLSESTGDYCAIKQRPTRGAYPINESSSCLLIAFPPDTVSSEERRPFADVGVHSVVKAEQRQACLSMRVMCLFAVFVRLLCSNMACPLATKSIEYSQLQS